MHDTSVKNARRFINTYVSRDQSRVFVDLGSKSYGGQATLRQDVPANIKYLGLDLEPGENVDLVMDDPYRIPLEDASVDYVVSSSCFEHSEFFWLSQLEIMRILKPGGLFYLCVPSNGAFHRYPVDCWRFYPDSAMALARWSDKNGLDCEVLEQYTSIREKDIWFDFVAVFVRGKDQAEFHKRRIIDEFNNYINGSKWPDLENYRNYSWSINVSPNPSFESELVEKPHGIKY